MWRVSHTVGLCILWRLGVGCALTWGRAASGVAERSVLPSGLCLLRLVGLVRRGRLLGRVAGSFPLAFASLAVVRV